MLNNIFKYFLLPFFLIIFLWLIITILYFREEVKIPKHVFIPQGSMSKIIQHLNKVTGDKFFMTDKYMLSYFGMPQHGWIELSKTELPRLSILREITQAKASTVSISLIPGETSYIFLQQIAEKYNLNFDKLFKEFLETSELDEGFLIPETYNFAKNTTTKNIIEYLIKFARKNHRKYMQKFNIHDSLEWKKYLIIASIIEKETAGVQEMPLISSVIYNRLNRNMRLQMDGTLNYGKYSHKVVTPERIRNDTSKFNTYKHKGIPDLPICNPSLDAIRSAIYPAKTNYLYFVKSKSENKHIFANSYKEHLRNIKSN
jgi:UPF0755 protein